MKRIIVICILALTAAYGCQVNELVEVDSESKSFTASIEDNCTKTSLDDQGNVRWKQGDQVSIFAGTTVNEQYQVTDASDGKTSAGFNKVSGSGFVSGGEIENNVAFYPYASTAEIAKNGSAYVISDISLPATQSYATESFGNGAFPMAAVTSTTDDMHLKFKNVLGGMKLQLKGTGTITSISVTGNKNEVLCGTAEVTVSNTNIPSIILTDVSARTVTLDCGEGVALDSETATPFIIALPPMTMEGGFTVIVTDTEGKQMEIKTTKSQTINRSKLLKMPSVTYEGEGIQEVTPLKFTSTGSTGISLTKTGSPTVISLEYKVDDGEWVSYTAGDVIDLTDGQEVCFRAEEGGNASFSQSDENYYSFSVTGSGTVAVSGDIMSLLNREGGLTIPAAYCFCRLFKGCTGLTSAPDLPATSLAFRCYYSMFEGCTGLTSAPELPATTLAIGCYSYMFSGCTTLTSAPDLPATTLDSGCYSGMFDNCTSLTAAPELPATTLANNCYFSMFRGCTSLTTAPELPATTLANICYYSMFTGCTSLTTAPELPATTLTGWCYSDMFRGCTSLTTAPELPATTLANGCYYQMFVNCTNLTTAPELPATTLALKCYYYMFVGCTNLTTAPELPATTLAESCYAFMFNRCTSLTTAPELPATTLAESCYAFMFSGCRRLNYIKALFTTTPNDTYTKGWVSSVASTGTFVKSKDATWDVTGVNGVPEGWTVYPTGLPSEAEAVDLGLSVKWANMNVGATMPEEYGDYFAWGETEPKADCFWWDTYKWSNGTGSTLTKYNTNSSYGTVDNKTVLDLEDDAAHVNWGGSWRMPTSTEIQELFANCTIEGTTENGVNGRRFTSNKEGYTDKSIFLPFAGSRNDTLLEEAGAFGYYWYSTLNTSYPSYAWCFYFSSDNVYRYSRRRRCFGTSVRPVTE